MKRHKMGGKFSFSAAPAFRFTERLQQGAPRGGSHVRGPNFRPIFAYFERKKINTEWRGDEVPSDTTAPSSPPLTYRKMTHEVPRTAKLMKKYFSIEKRNENRKHKSMIRTGSAIVR